MKLFRDEYDLVLAERLRKHPFLVCVASIALFWTVLILWAQHPWEGGSWDTTGFQIGLGASMLSGATLAIIAIKLVGRKARRLDHAESNSTERK